MKRRSIIRRLLPVFALVMASLPASAASAATYLFNLTGASSATFLLDSSPAPDATGSGFFTLQNVAGTYNGSLTTFTDLTFFLAGFTSGGLRVGSTLDLEGPQLFTGTVADPTFSLGAFTLDDGFNHFYNLTITRSAVPEPATWMMMLVGFGAIGLHIRRRALSLVSAQFAFRPSRRPHRQ